eukprot:Awhi_evm1s13103
MDFYFAPHNTITTQFNDIRNKVLGLKKDLADRYSCKADDCVSNILTDSSCWFKETMASNGKAWAVNWKNYQGRWTSFLNKEDFAI